MEIDRREFILAGGALAAGCASDKMPALKPEVTEVPDVAEVPADGEVPKRALILSPPVLQNAAETSMGVGILRRTALRNARITSQSIPP